ncbi:MAG: hypothetical protein AB1651_15065, partial [Pseudomonadota bacterium]
GVRRAGLFLAWKKQLATDEHGRTRTGLPWSSASTWLSSLPVFCCASDAARRVRDTAAVHEPIGGA